MPRTRPRQPQYKIDRDAFLVDIKLIKPLQTKLSDKKIEEIRNWMNPNTQFQITTVKKDGFYYIANGHHRIYVAYELGIKQIYVKERLGNPNRLFKRQTPGYDHIMKLDIVSHDEFKKYIKL